MKRDQEGKKIREKGSFKNTRFPFIVPRKPGQNNKEWVSALFLRSIGCPPMGFQVPEDAIRKFETRFGKGNRLDHMVAYDFTRYMNYLIRNKLIK